jgi:hypothetical protein
MELDLEFDINIDDYDLDFDNDFNLESRIIKPPLYKETKEYNLKYKYAQEIVENLGNLKEKDRYYVIVDGSFIFGDLIESLIIDKKYHVKSMTVSTLSLSENNIDSFALLLNNGFVDELNLIISAYFFSHERSNLIDYAYKELDKNNKFQLAVAGSHCKICIFETICGKHIVIHGSANLRSSGNIEQIEIENNKTLYNFNKEYQDNIINYYKTINKPIRSQKLWHQVVNQNERR